MYNTSDIPSLIKNAENLIHRAACLGAAIEGTTDQFYREIKAVKKAMRSVEASIAAIKARSGSL